MGVVYRARDMNLGRVVALKTLSADLDVDELIQKRFIREAEAIGRLSHPNIVAVYDLGNVEGRLFMAMELLDGRDLRQILASRPLPPLAERLRILIGIADGVGYAHSRGVVHRDLKPANIIVTAAGAVKILDFGLARVAASATITRRGMIMGTPDYMSPEQASGKELDHRTDVFSCGSVFYELLTGQKPFKGATLHSVLFQILGDEPPPLISLEPAVPAALAILVADMQRKDPAARPQSLLEVGARLRPIYAQVLRQALPGGAFSARGASEEDSLRRVRELLAKARDSAAGGDTRGALNAAHEALFVDPNSTEAAEVAWRTAEARGSARGQAKDLMHPERLSGLAQDAAVDRNDDRSRAAVEQLVLLAPDEPAVEALLRARAQRRRV
jgi:eukaryotic-like serine/threonine-protein kinase